MKKTFLCLILLPVFAIAASADEALVSIGDPKYLTQENDGARITYLRYPTLGCPAVVVRGTSGTALVRLPDGGATTDFELSITSNGDEFPQVFQLPVQNVTYDPNTGVYHVEYLVPSIAPEDMYDLALQVPGKSISDLQYNSFKVMAQETADFTVVVIADPQFNDPRGLMKPANHGPGDYDVGTIVDQIKSEVRALNPAFAIVIGDLCYGIDYDFEYDGAWNIWKDAGFPVFMVPGNHDGLASTVERTVLGITQKVRDGLDYWRRTFGPTYYSFSWGGVHFQGVNTFDGTAERRDSFLVVDENHGGDLSPEQMAWINWDLSGTAGTVVPFIHHSPLGPYRPNSDFDGFWGWTLIRIIEYIVNGDFDDYTQTWNTKATADFLLEKYQDKISFVIVGHEHRDDIRKLNGTTYRYITHAASWGEDYWGYAVARIEGGEVTDHIYQDVRFRSVPAGNLHVEHLTANDGTLETGTAGITSGLSRSYDVTIEFVVNESPAYAAVNGTVVQSSPLGDGTAKVWVRAAAPMAPSITEPESMEVTVQPGPVGGSVEESGGGGCGAPIGPREGASQVLVLAVMLLALVVARRLSR